MGKFASSGLESFLNVAYRMQVSMWSLLFKIVTLSVDFVVSCIGGRNLDYFRVYWGCVPLRSPYKRP